MNPTEPRPSVDPVALFADYLDHYMAVQFRLLDRVKLRAWLSEKSDEQKEAILAEAWKWSARHGGKQG